MEIRSKAVGDLDVERESGSNESSNQTDGHSCGPFVATGNYLMFFFNK